jgi:hypothetical protein
MHDYFIVQKNYISTLPREDYVRKLKICNPHVLLLVYTFEINRPQCSRNIRGVEFVIKYKIGFVAVFKIYQNYANKFNY